MFFFVICLLIFNFISLSKHFFLQKSFKNITMVVQFRYLYGFIIWMKNSVDSSCSGSTLYSNRGLTYHFMEDYASWKISLVVFLNVVILRMYLKF